MKKVILPLAIVIIFAVSFFASNSIFKDKATVYNSDEESPSQYINVHSFANLNSEYIESADVKMLDEKETFENEESGASCTITYRKIVLDEVNSNIANINLILNNYRDNFFASKSSEFKKDSSMNVKYDCTSKVTLNAGGILSIKQTLTSSFDDETVTSTSGLNFNLSTGKELLITDLFSMTYAKTSKYIKDKIITYTDENYKGDMTAFKNALDNYDAFDFIYYIEDDHICLFFAEEEYNEFIDAPLIINIPK